MRTRLVGLTLTLLVVVGSVTLSWLRGQDPPQLEKAPSKSPAVEPPLSTPAGPAALAPARDLSRLSELQKQMLLTAQRGADWLFRMNGIKGRFAPGIVPALRQPLESDSYLRQIGAARALGRAARICGEERYAARATQAILALLEDTAPDPTDNLSRYTTLHPALANRIGAAGALVLAIHELPAPREDLLLRAEELCRYLTRQVNQEGMPAGPEDTIKDKDLYPGLALAALMRSQRIKPAEAKLSVVRKALAGSRAHWKAHRSLEFVPAQSMAFAEAFVQTKEKAYADFVFEMNDWVCELQYAQINPRRMTWYGGFMSYQNGRAVESEPHALGAALVEGLVEGSRVAREVGDVTRHQRYTEAIERSLQFLATLQYTDAVTQHYAAWFRRDLVGGFHASPTDGNLRLDYTEHAVCAVLGYLEQVAR